MTLLLLLLSLLLLHTADSSVYTVIPDDHYYPNTTCHHCHNLQYYLLNATKYFTSNTQLLFLPGIHHLNTDLIIQNVHNISLIGTIPDTVIDCNSSVGIVIANVLNVVIMDIIFSNCTTNAIEAMNISSTYVYTSMIVVNCYDVLMEKVMILSDEKMGLLAVNVLGEFNIDSLKSKGINLIYNDDLNATKDQVQLNHTIRVAQFELISITQSIKDYISLAHYAYMSLYDTRFFNPFEDFTFNNRNFQEIFNGITLELYQTLYNVTILLSDTTFTNLKNYQVLLVYVASCSNSVENLITIIGCTFENNSAYQVNALVDISLLPCRTMLESGRNKINFHNCSFINNTYTSSVIKAMSDGEYILKLVPQAKSHISIIGCLFQVNTTQFINFISDSADHEMLLIENTKFIYCYDIGLWSITLSNVNLILKGPVIFHEVRVQESLINTINDISFYDYIEISNSVANSLISGGAYFNLNIMEYTHVNITNSTFKKEMFLVDSGNDLWHSVYSPCYFQFYKSHQKSKGSKKPIITITSNLATKVFSVIAGNINCRFYSKSLHYGQNPLIVYPQHIQLNSITGSNPPFTTGLLCYCLNNTQLNCSTNYLGPIYPGQHIHLQFALNPLVTPDDTVPISVKIYVKNSPYSVCQVSSMFEAEQRVTQNCTEVNYSILSEDKALCILVLYNTNYRYPTIYYVKLLKCPPGFAFDIIEKSCQCDKILQSTFILITKCNINDQKIQRPANSWIGSTTTNNSYNYHVCLHCPFHYCLPYSSHLNFSTPNSQCQFNRSGVLCGHCPHGFSTVFGSLDCRCCSNIYLALTVPVAIAGLVLVLVLFLLNLTVTEGTINAFILYANIISINTPVFFHHLDGFVPAYTFISLVNLDLGVQTCFYNGMDDYAKMWLQLSFPAYLIFIATSLIITSRYSSKVQKLTARRGLPVLATLLLLSYTKVLRIVSSVLFSYSTITHLPSKHTTLVWSIDATLPLFGVKFTIMFIICIIIFLMMVPFNATLLITKTMSHFNIVTKFRPLIDTYQGPYKCQYYYWTGAQLLIRVVFFAISSLDRNLNLTIGMLLLSLITTVQGVVGPYKNKTRNYHELAYMLNLHGLYTITLYLQDTTSTMAVNVLVAMAALHFSIIIMYHISTYTCDGVIRRKLNKSVATLIRWMKQSSVKHQKFQLEDNTRNRIPEVAFNYCELQEPLVGLD